MTSPDAVRSKDSPRGVSERGRRALTDVGCVNGGMGLMGLGDGADDDEEEDDNVFSERTCVSRAVSSDEAYYGGREER